MPTNRKRISRIRRADDLTPEELEWLTGVPQAGANAFWKFRCWLPDQLARCRELVERHAALIPPGRLPKLLQDIEHWAPQKPRGLASFRNSPTTKDTP